MHYKAAILSASFLISHICFFETNSDRPSISAAYQISLRRLGDTGLGVGDLDTQSLGLGDDLDSLSGGYGVCDLGGVDSVVHEEELDVSGVVDEESLVA